MKLKSLLTTLAYPPSEASCEAGAMRGAVVGLTTATQAVAVDGGFMF